MAYTRRRRPSRRRSQPDAGSGRVLLAIIVVGAVIYLVSASAAGTWVAENVIAPAFAAIDNLIPTPAPTVEAPAAASAKAPLAEQVTAQVEMPAMTCFALQMGVYQSRENADARAGEIQGQGAGGFIMEDGGRYRVLAAAYADEASLRQVREQLTAEGMECAAYTLAVPERLLQVTAVSEQTGAMQDAFTALHELQGELTAAALRFDREQQSPAEGRESAAALRTKLQSACEGLAVLDQAEGSGVIAALTACYRDCDTALADLLQYQTESFVDFSSKMKYTQLYTADAYAALAERIAAA